VKRGGEEVVDSIEQRSGIVIICLFNILTEDVIDYTGEIAVNGL
jgi:hypothetical protein